MLEVEARPPQTLRRPKTIIDAIRTMGIDHNGLHRETTAIGGPGEPTSTTLQFYPCGSRQVHQNGTFHPMLRNHEQLPTGPLSDQTRNSPPRNTHNDHLGQGQALHKQIYTNPIRAPRHKTAALDSLSPTD